MIAQRDCTLNLEKVHPLHIDTIQGLKLGVKGLDRGFIAKDVEKDKPARRAARGIGVVDTQSRADVTAISCERRLD